jgi:hypothetical protein
MARRTNDKKAVLSKNLPTKAKGFSSYRTEKPHLRPCRVWQCRPLVTHSILARREREGYENLEFSKIFKIHPPSVSAPHRTGSPERPRPIVADPARRRGDPPRAVPRRAERTGDTGRRCHANTPGPTRAPRRTGSISSSASPSLAGGSGSIVATDAPRRCSPRTAHGRSVRAFGAPPTMTPWRDGAQEAPTMEPARDSILGLEEQSSRVETGPAGCYRTDSYNYPSPCHIFSSRLRLSS